MNSGGIRDSIQEGDVTYKDILKIHPFGNIVSYFELTGKELLDYLNVVALKKWILVPMHNIQVSA